MSDSTRQPVSDETIARWCAEVKHHADGLDIVPTDEHPGFFQVIDQTDPQLAYELLKMKVERFAHSLPARQAWLDSQRLYEIV